MFHEPILHYLSQLQYKELTPKAVFFDMDGVLYDSMPFHASAWVQAMHDIGIPFTITEAYMNEGRTGHSTIDGSFIEHKGRIATEDEKQEIYWLKTKYFDAYKSAPVMPYAAELIQKLKSSGIAIYLVTGSGQASLLDNLERNFPTIFQKENMVTAFDVVKGKPDPEPYLMAQKKSGLKGNEIVVVENAPLGVQSAKAAGLFCIAVNTGPLATETLYESGADIVFADVASLFDAWDNFETSSKSTQNLF